MPTHRRARASLWLLAAALALAVSLPAGVAAEPVAPVTGVRLTSLTLDPEDASGATTNAPGSWSTNLADPLSQAGVWSGGRYLNIPTATVDLGEISIPLKAGTNVLKLCGTGTFPGNLYYGAVLFFDGRRIGPQIAVYNRNGAQRRCLVQPKDTVIMGGANGGLFFDKAPGTAAYTAPDGTRVEVVAFTIDAQRGQWDRVGRDDIGPDGTPDMVATLTLKVTAPRSP